MNQTPKPLDGRVAIVTGAGSGIGAASALALAREGCAIAINYVGESAGADDVREAVLRAGVRAVTMEGDVGDPAIVERIFAHCNQELGAPDILVNNAGRNGQHVHVADMTWEQWQETLRVNLGGPFLCSRAFMRERRGKVGAAAIVNISSIHENIVMLGFADYDASKAGLLALTRTLAAEAAALGVTVNSIAPGMILTAMNKEAQNDPAVREEKAEHIPLKRAGKPEDIAALVVYLCSKQGAYITGASMRVDGGLSLNAGQGA